MSRWNSYGFPTSDLDTELIPPQNTLEEVLTAASVVRGYALVDEREILDMLGLP